MVFNYGLASQMFGASRSGGRRRHAGIDLGTGGKKGVPVGCPLDGCKVIYAKKRGGYGNTVEVETPDGKRMLFAHLAEPMPKHIQPGVELDKGDWLGDVGGTGGKYAIHLHFEYKVPDGKGGYKPVNPVSNKHHSFTRAEFEETTFLASQQKSGQRAFLAQKNRTTIASEALATGQTKIDQVTVALSETLKQNDGYAFAENKTLARTTASAKTAKENGVWTFDRGFDQPNWWEKHALPIFGGWTQDKLDKAQEQKERDEELFTGVKVGQLLDKGISKKDIAQIKSYVKEQTLLGNLNGHALCLTSVFEGDKDKALEVYKAYTDIKNDVGRG